MNKVILYIATSQDGFIADEDGNVDWLPQPNNEGELEEVGYFELMNRIDTILMGSRSYAQILTFGDWGWPDKHTTIFSSQAIESTLPCIAVTKESPAQFIKNHAQRQTPQDIWLLGGAKLINSFAELHLIDEAILTVTSDLLGAGIPLGLDLTPFKCVSEKAISDTMIQKHYIKRA